MRAAHAFYRSAPRTASLVCIATLVPLIDCASADTKRKPTTTEVTAQPSARSATTSSSAELAQRDPVALLRVAQQRCQRDVGDYSCVFLRQERIGGKLTKQQAIRVLYRDTPRSVHMTWVRNRDNVKRALYVEGRNLDKNGQEQILVEPAGAIARLFVSEVRIPVHGEEACKASRQTIDQFGFRASLERINDANERFAKQGALEWKYEGEGSIDGRPTYILARHLPYAGPNGKYPDARLVVHLDRQRLLPVGLYSYADQREEVLLGSYITTEVELNPGLADVAFRF